MPVTEESRHRLHQALDRTIGEEDATTLMEHLPPVGWADVATKTDLATLQTVLEARFEAIDVRFDAERVRADARFTTINDQFKVVNDQFKVVNDQFSTVHREIAGVNDQFSTVHREITGVQALIVGLGQRIDGFDRRFEAQTARVDHLVWQVIGLLGVIGLVLIGYAQIFA